MSRSPRLRVLLLPNILLVPPEECGGAMSQADNFYCELKSKDHALMIEYLQTIKSLGVFCMFIDPHKPASANNLQRSRYHALHFSNIGHYQMRWKSWKHLLNVVIKHAKVASSTRFIIHDMAYTLNAQKISCQSRASISPAR